MSRLLTRCDHINIDTETTGMYPQVRGHRITHFSLYDPKGISQWLPATPANIRRIKTLMAARSVAKIGHNLKFDLKMMWMFGIKQWLGDLHDTLILAHLLDPDSPKGLEQLCRRHFNDPCLEDEQLHRWLKQAQKRAKRQERRALREDRVEDAQRWAQYLIELKEGYQHVPPALLERYGRLDTRRGMKLFYLMHETVEERFPEVYRFERQLVPHVARMELTGVQIDARYTAKRAKELSARLAKIRTSLTRRVKRKIKGIDDFNPGSYPQVITALKAYNLEERLPRKIIGRNFVSAKPDTSEDAMSDLNHPFVNDILLYRTLNKMYGTYFEGFQHRASHHEDRPTIHTRYNQCGARTGRFSSSDPNLQNIPLEGAARMKRAEYQHVYRGIKRMFLARKGYYHYHHDYKQIELRLFAHLSRDRKAIEFIMSGRDFHDETCRAMFGKVEKKLRVIAKMVNFGILYGMGVKTFMFRLKKTEAEVKAFMARYYSAFPSVRAFQSRTMSEVRTHGGVTTGHGRFIPIPRQLAYKGVNGRIQGFAADLLKRAMLEIADWLLRRRLRSRLLMQIHDELVTQVPFDEVDIVPPMIAKIMERQADDARLIIPLTVDIERTKTSWDRLKPARVRRLA